MKNTVTLVGFVGNAPEVRDLASGQTVTSVSLATSRRWKDGEGKRQSETEWHRVTCFNGLGRIIAQHAVKGMLGSVRGRLHNTKWTDREGIERYGYEIIADDVQFLSRPRQDGDAGESESQPELDEDVPF